VIQAQPAMMAAVRNRLDAIAEAEVLAASEEGKLVVVLDTANSRETADTITDIQNQAGILSATLIYQFDDQFKTRLEDSA
jgi:nitrate reductase NapD